ncbi:MAG: hypothetical protein AB7O65_06045 [Candidatus Korobacteraceae bacterium]
MASQCETLPEMAKPRSMSERLLAGLRRAAALVLETLREIFDENAYRRFLLRRGMAPSRAAYGEFLEEMRQRRERRVKCC